MSARWAGRRRRVRVTASGRSRLNQYRLPGGASCLAALLIAHLCPISSLFAPCDPGAAPRISVTELRFHDTRSCRYGLPRGRGVPDVGVVDALKNMIAKLLTAWCLLALTVTIHAAGL